MGLLAEITVVGVALLASVRYGGKPVLLGAALLSALLVFDSVELALLLGKSALCGILLDVGRRARASFGQMMTKQPFGRDATPG